MSRLLTVSRVTVSPEFEAEYLRTVQALAELGVSRGQRLWLFRSPETPHTFLECSESRTEFTHRARASRTDYELKLERRLQAIAHYSPGSWDLWEEVPLAASAESSEADPGTGDQQE
jgi:hypothetical protein